MSYGVVVRVVDERSGLREAVVKICGKVVAVILFRCEDSLMRVLEGVKVVRSVWRA